MVCLLRQLIATFIPYQSFAESVGKGEVEARPEAQEQTKSEESKKRFRL